jgi:hypothetical protein
MHFRRIRKLIDTYKEALNIYILPSESPHLLLAFKGKIHPEKEGQKIITGRA